MILTGVLSERNSRLEKKLPILGDLPLLGALFRSSSEIDKKKELVITVTPKIIEENTGNRYYIPNDPEINSNINP